MTDRKCGSCTLCCRLVPVKEIGKKANTRCEHQRHTGCAIYQHRPSSCRLWSCAWLKNKDMGDQLRPDRSHIVVDPNVETIWSRDNDTGERQAIGAVEMWCDPRFPDAHKDEKIRAFMERRGMQNLVTMIRYDSQQGFVIFPPSITRNGTWLEKVGDIIPEEEARRLKAEMPLQHD